MLTILQVNLLQNSSLIDEVGVVLHSDLLNKNIKQEKIEYSAIFSDCQYRKFSVVIHGFVCFQGLTIEL